MKATRVRYHGRKTKRGMTPVREHTRAYQTGYKDAQKTKGELIHIPYQHYIQYHKSSDYMDGFAKGQKPFLTHKK